MTIRIDPQVISRRAVLAALSASAAVIAAPPLAAQTTTRPKTNPNRLNTLGPPPSLGAIINAYAAPGAHSIVVMDVQSGRILEQHDAKRALPPASTAKAITTLYALRTLGSSFRFQTRLVANGRISGGVLNGDLTLVGGGDPHLDTDGLANLVAGLKAKGITRITGKFRVYYAALPYQKEIDPDQLDFVSYNPSISGLNLNFNRVYFEWKRSGAGHALSLAAQTKRYKPKISGISIRAVNRDKPTYAYRLEGGRDSWTVAAPRLGGGGSRWLPVRNPADYAGETFRTLARSQGVVLPRHGAASSPPKGVVVAQQTGAELSKLTRSMLKFSTNLTAEVVGLQATQRRGAVKTLAQSGKAMSQWANKTYGVKSVALLDHSGLSAKSRINGADLARILQQDGFNGPLRALMKPVGLRNADWKPAALPGVNINAKTGTLSFASSLAGYIDCPNGRQLAFAVMSANVPARDAIPQDKREAPPGARGWARRSRILQHQLIRRWALTYGR